jgi:ribonuclease VapC
VNKVVIDASAVLALLHKETGWQEVAERIDGAIISTVNLVEVLDKLTQRGMTMDVAKDALDFLRLDIRDFTRPFAEAASSLLPHTKSFGLSLADRACLGVARLEKAVALTGDRVWKQLQDIIGVEVVLIR